MLEKLKSEVCNANKELERLELVTLTWGNVSGIDRRRALIVIKPSGVSYVDLIPTRMVVVDVEGRVVEGEMLPSSDTSTHVALYRAFPAIGGIAHTHSTFATIFAQACREIPCLGTTHADAFAGAVPVTRFLTESEVRDDYEGNTGKIIVERFAGLDPFATPGILVAGHAPFAFGSTAAESVKNALVLERVAKMALGAIQLNPALTPLPPYIHLKHQHRKHGPDAYYGQPKKEKK